MSTPPVFFGGRQGEQMADGLGQSDRELLARAILEGRKIPAKYAPSVMESSPEMELVFSGKSDLHEQVVLPFQSIEHIDEPRTELNQLDSLFTVGPESGRQASGWSNKLIWGDNKLILSSLTQGPLRRDIDAAGGLKLVYIDPPFDVGADFSMEVIVGEESVTKEASIVEQVAYRDTWGKGQESYVNMIRQRLMLIYDLMHENSSIFVHVDWRVNSYVRVILDEIFGKDAYRNEIAWCYSGPSNTRAFFPRKHDSILFYGKGEPEFFQPRVAHKSGVHNTGQLFKRSSDEGSEEIQKSMEEKGKALEDWWIDIYAADRYRSELVGYPTQKPEALLERIIEATTVEGDLVADFFCGSGTTLAVSEKLGRKWLGTDLGRFAIHTSRKRLISVQRERKELGLSYRAFEILNLGSYERQHYVESSELPPGGSEADPQAVRTRRAFEDLVLSAYQANRAAQLPPFCGVKGQTAVFIGGISSYVTQGEVEACIEAALELNVSKIDVLGFEFEMGISPVLSDQAKEKGVTLTLRYIPSDVFDARAVKAGLIHFYEVGYLEVIPESKNLNLRLRLSDFGVFYRQEDADVTASSLRPGDSRVVVDEGQVIKVIKSKSGVITREPVTRQWQDWIDYWSVDFNFESKPEVVRKVVEDKEVELTTGKYIFENEWQTFRTSRDRQLELATVWYAYENPGIKRVAIKVIDIFGNDTTKVISVKVG